MPSLEKPLPSSLSAENGRDQYLAENGFDVAEYDAPRTKATAFGINFSVPNTPSHRWAIMRHDLHHVATGYGTDLAGEAEISAWELRQGFKGLSLYVSAIVLGGAVAGMLIAPARTLRAWKQAGEGKGSLFADGRSYEELLQMSVGELREALGIRREGLPEQPRGLHGNAPKG